MRLMMDVSFDAMTCTQNGKTFYLAIFPKKILEKTTFVSRREKNQKDGFQRNLNEARAKDIARYFDEKKGVIPSPLILSAQKESNFYYKNGSIHFKDAPLCFMVLDGQHRLYGLLKTKYDYSFPVVIFNDLSSENEVSLFIDINTNQKGVPATLLLDIRRLTGNENSLEEKQRYLFDELNKDSIMAGMFSPFKSQVGKITRVSFNKATKDFIENSVVSRMSEQKILQALKNYLEASEFIFKTSKSQKAKLNNSMFFRSIFAIANDVLEKSVNSQKNIKIESLKLVMEPLAKLNYDSYTGSSNATFSKIVSDMKYELKGENFITPSEEIF